MKKQYCYSDVNNQVYQIGCTQHLATERTTNSSIKCYKLMLCQYSQTINNKGKFATGHRGF
jgi:hypothetical protein